MSNTIAIKRRIRSVGNTRQITKAMELVAASKMRRAQETATKSRDYRNTARQILSRLRELTDVNKHPLYTIRPVRARLLIIITSDRGLAGAYNSNALRKLTRELTHDSANQVSTRLITIGKKAASFASRLKQAEVLAVYENFPDYPTANDIRPLLDTVTKMYIDKQVDAVDVLYTDYKSSIVQLVTIDRLLPAAFSESSISSELERAVFEPSVQAVLDTITLRLIEAQLSQIFLEARASEHSMRMMAMKNATDNADELIDDLTLAFNTVRQAAITQELAEITGGAEAMK